jgi:hypothetical protein
MSRFLVFSWRYAQYVSKVSILPYNPSSNDFPVELSGWSKRAYTLEEVSHQDIASTNALIATLISPQSKNIVISSLLPGKLFQAAIIPTATTGKEGKVASKMEIKSTCGCPVDDETLRDTEQTGKPTDIVLTQVCRYPTEDASLVCLPCFLH